MMEGRLRADLRSCSFGSKKRDVTAKYKSTLPCEACRYYGTVSPIFTDAANTCDQGHFPWKIMHTHYKGNMESQSSISASTRILVNRMLVAMMTKFSMMWGTEGGTIRDKPMFCFLKARNANVMVEFSAIQKKSQHALGLPGLLRPVYLTTYLLV
jgi:hypothetical protein